MKSKKKSFFLSTYLRLDRARERNVEFSETWTNKSSETGWWWEEKWASKPSNCQDLRHYLLFTAWLLLSKKLMITSLKHISLGGALFKDTKSIQNLLLLFQRILDTRQKSVRRGSKRGEITMVSMYSWFPLEIGGEK